MTVANPTDFDLERDMPLTAEDIEAMRRARFRVIDPTQLEWDWISLGVQFPHLSRERKTHEGVPDFELPPLHLEPGSQR